MSKDKRVKGCPNVNCIKHKEKVHFNAEDKFCSECASELTFVCASCYGRIEDLDVSHRICKRCEIEKKDKRAKWKVDRIVNVAENTGKAIEKVADGAKSGKDKLIDKGKPMLNEVGEKINLVGTRIIRK